MSAVSSEALGCQLMIIPSSSSFTHVTGKKHPSKSEAFCVSERETKVLARKDSENVRLPSVTADRHNLNNMQVRSKELNLNVVLEGHRQPVAASAVSVPVNNKAKNKPLPPVTTTDTSVASKPAILASFGTTQPISIQSRPITGRRQNQKQVDSTTLSTGSGNDRPLADADVKKGPGSVRSRLDITVAVSGPGTSTITDVATRCDGEFKTDQQLQVNDGADQSSQTSSLSSVQELVEEAHNIALTIDELNRKKQRGKKMANKAPASGESSGKQTSKKFVVVTENQLRELNGQSELTANSASQRKSKRTVDEIIASLNDFNQFSDSNKKIQEIMDGLMYRTTAMFGNIEGTVEMVPQADKLGEKVQEDMSAAGLETSTSADPTVDHDGDTASNCPSVSESYDEQQLMEQALLQLSAVSEAEEFHSGDSRTRPTTGGELSVRSAVSRVECHSINSDADINQKLSDLNASTTVTNEDIISIRAQQAVMQPRQPHRSQVDDVPVDKDLPLEPASSTLTLDRSVHHFCISSSESQLPYGLRAVWRPYHVGRKDERLQLDTGCLDAYVDDEALGLMQSRAAEQIMKDVTGSSAQPACNKSIDSSKDVPIEIVAEKLTVNEKNFENMYWTPAPPKWSLAPAQVKTVLFPYYRGSDLQGAFAPLKEETSENVDSSDNDEEDVLVTMTQHQSSNLPAVKLQRRFRSVENIDDLSCLRESSQLHGHEEQSDSEQQQQQDRVDVVSQHLPEFSLADDVIHLGHSYSVSPNRYSGLKRRLSAPSGLDMEEDFLVIHQDFRSIFDEISSQQQQYLSELGRDKSLPASEMKCDEKHSQNFSLNVDTEPPPTGDKTTAVSQEQGSASNVHDAPTTAAQKTTRKEQRGASKTRAKKSKHKSVRKPCKRSRTPSRRTPRSLSFLGEAPSPLLLTCRSAPPTVNSALLTSSSYTDTEHPANVRRASLSDELDFNEYKKSRGYDPATEVGKNEREWVRDIWNDWFDQVFPPTPRESTPLQQVHHSVQQTSNSSLQTQSPITAYGNTASDYKQHIYLDDAEFSPAAELSHNDIELLEYEVRRLTDEISRCDCDRCLRPYDLCRRGAIYRRLGRVRQAKADLDLAIDLQPGLIDAYWQRHLVNVLLNRTQLAVDDLNSLLQLKKSHVAALKSRGLLYASLGETALALHSLNMALKFQPDDQDVFLYRAEIYEKAGESLMAMEDYAACCKIKPPHTDALLKRASHMIAEKNWALAINDLDRLLEVNPSHAEAWYCRGRSRAELKQWTEAVEDLSTAVHLDPNNAAAFYYRGCLLRKIHPKKALQDLSISLVIDNSFKNILCYLQRGMLYSELGKPHEAIADLECVVKLDPSASDAYINLGLIHLQQLNNCRRAIKSFSDAIQAKPTNSKALMCRAEAYQRINNLSKALVDVNRVIHLHPDMTQLYVWRGDILRKIGDVKLATFCISQLAELSGTVYQNPMQQAIVHAFLKDYHKAIVVLEEAVAVNPTSVEMLAMLGKTYTKAGYWKSAIDNFNSAIRLMLLSTNNTAQKSKGLATEMGNIFYQVGMCYVELCQYKEAQDAFSSSLKYNSRHAESFYWRGVTKLKMSNRKGIQDVNRSLAIDPNYYQAYLTRAVFFGQQGNYTKAILNCNEAVKLKPHGVRAYLYRGAFKYHIHAYLLAIDDLNQAIQRDAVCQSAYYNRALCHQASKNIPQALKDYGIVLMLGGDVKELSTESVSKTKRRLTLSALINRSLIYLRVGDYSNALHDLLLASELSPSNKYIFQTKGFCFHRASKDLLLQLFVRRLGRLQEAVLSYTAALKLDRFFIDAIIGRGNAFLDFRHSIGYQFARRDYERALHVDPTCVTASFNLGHCFQIQGHFMLAWNQFTAAIAVNPTFVAALEGRAIVNLQMSNLFAALEDINRAISVQRSAELLTNRGVIHQFYNDVVNAMRDYQQAIRIDPTYALAYFNAANIYFYNKQFKQAEAYYDSAIKHNAQDESVFLNRAITKVMLKDNEGALEDFTRAVQASPHSAHIYFNRANLYVTMNRLEKAEDDYNRVLELKPDDWMTLLRRSELFGKTGRRQQALDDYKLAVDIQSNTKRIQYRT